MPILCPCLKSTTYLRRKKDMKIVLVSATPFEIAPTLQWLEQNCASPEPGQFTLGEHQVQVLVTGVGMIATAWRMGVYLAKFPADLLLNAGIAGTIDPTFTIGQVVHVTEQQFADLGAEDADGQLLDLFDLNLMEKNDFPFSNKKLVNPQAGTANFLPKARGITVNKGHGSAASIQTLKAKYPEAQVESLEGAAFFWGALHAGIPFMEIRAISNAVEPRNRDNWNIPLAINNLNQVLVELLSGMATSGSAE